MPSSLPQHVGVGLPCFPAPAHGRGCSDPGCRKLPRRLTLALCTPLGLVTSPAPAQPCACADLSQAGLGMRSQCGRFAHPSVFPHGPCFSNCNLQGRLGAFDFFVWCPAFEQYRGHDQPLPHRHLCHPLGVERKPKCHPGQPPAQGRSPFSTDVLCPRAVMSS